MISVISARPVVFAACNCIYAFELIAHSEETDLYDFSRVRSIFLPLEVRNQEKEQEGVHSFRMCWHQLPWRTKLLPSRKLPIPLR